MKAWFLVILIALGGAPLANSEEPQTPAKPGKVGIGYHVLPEGLVVTKIIPGKGADQAGIRVGDLLLSADGEPIGGDGPPARKLLMGPTGTEVEIALETALGGGPKQVSVTRGLSATTQPPTKKRTNTPDVIRAYQHAIRHKGRKKVAKAAQNLVDNDFGGWVPGKAVSGSLRVAAKRNPRIALAAADVFRASNDPDPLLQERLVEIYHRLDQYSMATTMFAEIEANRAPDIQGPDWTADAGGNAKAREAWIGDLIQLGEMESAKQILTSLERVGNFPTLRVQLGMPERPNHPWRATLHPEEDFVVSPLQGPQWSLSDHRGEVVLLSFWATWCQPCRKELPELVELQQQFSAQGFQLLAISVDDDNEATLKEVAKYAQKLGIASQVAHSQDLGKRFAVDAIPALRLLGKNGELRYEAKGYSKTALERLEKRIHDVLEDPHDGASPIGAVWDESPAKLLKFVPLADADALWADSEHIVVSVQGASPAIFNANGEMQSAPDGSEGYTWATQMVAWLDGPIGSDRGKHWIRAWDADGMTRWLITTPSPVQALIRADDKIWVAIQNQVLVIDANGTVVAQADGQYSSLLYDDGHVWAGNDASSWQLSMHPASTDAGAHIVATQKSDGGATLGPNGIRAGAIVSQALTGRFGPNGESRLVVARPDGVVIGYDQQYRPTFLLSLDQTVRLAHTDSDKNGKDELLISVTNQGLAIVDLTLP